MIADEIQSGLARSGKLLACHWEDVRPDVVVSFFYFSFFLLTFPIHEYEDETIHCSLYRTNSLPNQ